MTFLQPLAAGWALLAIPIVMLYLLKVTVRRVPVSTVMFWKEIQKEQTTRALSPKIRHVFSLLLQLLMLFLLVLAVTQPQWATTVNSSKRTVLIIDCSASMRAMANGQSRLENAKLKALNLLTASHPDDQFAVLAAGGRTIVKCGFTNHHRTVKQAIQQLQQTDASAELPSAIALAKRLSSGQKESAVAVITDGCGDIPTRLTTDALIAWHLIGHSHDNVAITAFQLRRSLVDPASYEVLLRIANCADLQVEASVDMKLNGQLIDVINVTVPANDSVTRILQKTSAKGGILSAKLNFNDVNQHDNIAETVLPDFHRISVQLVDTDNWFLQQALQASPIVELVSSTTGLRLPTVRIFEQDVPVEFGDGAAIVVNPNRDTNLWNVSGTLELPLAGKGDTEHPILRHVHLQNALMSSAVQLQPKGRHDVLLESADGVPLLLRFPRKNGDIIVLTVNLNEGDLPLRTAFPILLTNMLVWLDSANNSDVPIVAAGDVAEILLPMPLTELAQAHGNYLLLSSPNDQRQLVSVLDGMVRFGPLDSAGIWLLTRPLTAAEQAQIDIGQTPNIDGPFLQFTCSRSASECDLRTKLDLSQQPNQTTQANRSPIWSLLTLLVLVCMLGEWALYHRQVVC